MYVLYCGFHTQEAYSRCGLTNALYSIIKVDAQRNSFPIRMMKPSILYDFATIFLIWLLKRSLSSMITPSSTFRLMRHVHLSITLHNMMNYFRIAAALINAYHVLIVDNVHATDILQIIGERINMPNTLGDLVNRHNLNRRRAQFQPMAADMADFNDFPTLTEEDLILFSLGVYQLKQAKSYYGEHLQSDGAFIIELGGGIPLEIVRELEGEDLWIIRGRIQSRHIQAKKYYVYIALDRAANGRRALAHYYCTCNIGKRTIGCCSHTMTIVWYMGYARHDPYLTPPAIALDDVYVRLGQI